MLKKNLHNQQTAEELIAAAGQAREQGLLTEAIKHYQSALAAGLMSPDDEATVRCLLAETFEHAGLYRELLSTISKYDSPAALRPLSRLTQMQVMIHLGWSYSRNDDIPRAVALFDQVLRTAQPDDLAIIAACHTGLGRAYRVYSEIQFARDHYMTAIEYFRRTGELTGLSESYIGLAYVDLKEGACQEALDNVNTVLALLKGSKDAYSLGVAYETLAVALSYLDDLAPLPAIFEACMENARKTGALTSLMNAANNYAMMLVVTGDWARGEEIGKSALEIAQNVSNPAYKASCYDTLAQVIMPQGRIAEADTLLANALQLLNTITTGKWAEVAVEISMGRCCLFKDQPDQAINHFQRAITICEKIGSLQLRTEARVWLSEALMEVDRFDDARSVIEAARSELRRTPNMDPWGHLTRMIARYEFHQGRIEKAIQSINQSSSVFEIRGAVYARAVNRIVLAQILEACGQLPRAIDETESALAAFERLGAIDADKTRTYLGRLKNERQKQIGDQVMNAAAVTVSDRESILDGFMTERLLDASVSRRLLLHELASISREQSGARAAIIIEASKGNKFSIAASIGIADHEQQEIMRQVSDLNAEEYAQNYVYSFTDGDKTVFLLRIIEPKADRFTSGNIDLKPLLYLVEYGLQRQLSKSQVRKRPTFDSSVVQAEAEVTGFICKGPAMTRVLEQIHKIRSSNAAVLITGESGSGKELVARAVHAASARKFGTFLPFNCSSVARDMVESQLFGYRKGSFTGAAANYAGVIRAAEHGTLFLDEIGEMPIDLQPKLLRFLQEGEIHPLGETKPIKVDVRLVAATNVDLEKEVAKGRFREDLFYRLNVIRVHVPPLRERREEIPALIAYYLKQYQQQEGKIDIVLSQEAIDLMIVYDWPGNVRQLCNELRRLVAYNESGSTLNVDSLSPEIVGPGQVWFSKPEKPKTENDLSLVDSRQTLSEATDDLERNMIQAALRRSSGNIAQAAKELGLSRGGLYLKMNRLKLQI